jgi:hypothetical protein
MRPILVDLFMTDQQRFWRNRRRPRLIIGASLLIFALGSGCRTKSVSSMDLQIITDVSSGKLIPDSTGRVYLPQQYASASCDGSVYVTRGAKGELFVYFPEYRGKGANSSGLLYSSVPIPVPSSSFYIYAGDSFPPSPPGTRVKKVPMNISEQKSPNFFTAFFSLD